MCILGIPEVCSKGLECNFSYTAAFPPSDSTNGNDHLRIISGFDPMIQCIRTKNDRSIKHKSKVEQRKQKGFGDFLVGGFNPFEKYARQIGSFPQVQ